MKILSLHHAPFEGLGCIKDWIDSKGFTLSSTNLYETDQLPGIDSFDMLIVMGGPMGVYDDDKYPWLRKEKLFIRNSAEKGKAILGICLGSQLVAEILGEKIYKNKFKEIGWFPITITNEARKNSLFNFFPKELTVFHWHGDTYNLPHGSIHLAQSEGCRNQGFIFNDRVVGLQFHLEAKPETIKEMISGSGDDLLKDAYVQTSEEILSMTDTCNANNAFMFELLNRIANVLSGNGLKG